MGRERTSLAASTAVGDGKGFPGLRFKAGRTPAFTVFRVKDGQGCDG